MPPQEAEKLLLVNASSNKLALIDCLEEKTFDLDNGQLTRFIKQTLDRELTPDEDRWLAGQIGAIALEIPDEITPNFISALKKIAKDPNSTVSHPCLCLLKPRTAKIVSSVSIFALTIYIIVFLIQSIQKMGDLTLDNNNTATSNYAPDIIDNAELGQNRLLVDFMIVMFFIFFGIAAIWGMNKLIESYFPPIASRMMFFLKNDPLKETNLRTFARPESVSGQDPLDQVQKKMIACIYEALALSLEKKLAMKIDCAVANAL